MGFASPLVEIKWWMVTNMCYISSSLEIVFYFARNIHAHAYDALSNITSLKLSFVLPVISMRMLMMLSAILHSWCITSMLCMRINVCAYGSSHNAHIWVQLCSSPYPSYPFPSLFSTNLLIFSAVSSPLRRLSGPFLMIVYFLKLSFYVLKGCFSGNQHRWQLK
jgi:hypothetical protein